MSLYDCTLPEKLLSSKSDFYSFSYQTFLACINNHGVIVSTAERQHIVGNTNLHFHEPYPVDTFPLPLGKLLISCGWMYFLTKTLIVSWLYIGCLYALFKITAMI